MNSNKNVIAFVFPGQGSQAIGMLSDLVEHFPEVKSTFDQASDVLGYDLWQLVSMGPAEKLDQTTFTQPALLASSYAIWRIIQAHAPIMPSVLAGHSLGEYTALVCANAISFADGLRLVAARGEYMQDAVPAGKGGLAAIVGLPNEKVATICQQAAGDQILVPANFNSVGQVVIAGDIEAITRGIALAKAEGAKIAKQLPVSVPSHSPLMKPAADRLAKLLATVTISQPSLEVINNVDVLAYQSPESIRDGLVRQLVMPVRWVETIESFTNRGITRVIECGPGKVLTSLIKRISSDITVTPTADLTSLQTLLKATLETE